MFSSHSITRFFLLTTQASFCTPICHRSSPLSLSTNPPPLKLQNLSKLIAWGRPPCILVLFLPRNISFQQLLIKFLGFAGGLSYLSFEHFLVIKHGEEDHHNGSIICEWVKHGQNYVSIHPRLQCTIDPAPTGLR